MLCSVTIQCMYTSLALPYNGIHMHTIKHNTYNIILKPLLWHTIFTTCSFLSLWGKSKDFFSVIHQQSLQQCLGVVSQFTGKRRNEAAMWSRGACGRRSSPPRLKKSSYLTSLYNIIIFIFDGI